MKTRAAWRDFFSMRVDRPAWREVLRLSAPVLIPLVGLGVAGRLLEGVLIALGAYIVLFAAALPANRRP